MKISVAYNYAGTRGESNVATITPGTNPSVSFGADRTISSSNANYFNIVYSPTAEKLLVAYRLPPNYFGFARVATISGTTASYGTEVNFSYTGSITPKMVYNTTTTNIAVLDNANPTVVRELSISGTAVTTTGNTASANSQINYINFIYDDNADRGVLVGGWDDDATYGVLLYTFQNMLQPTLHHQTF